MFKLRKRKGKLQTELNYLMMAEMKIGYYY